MMRAALVRLALALLAVTTTTACSVPGGTSGAERPPTTIGTTARPEAPVGRPEVVTLAFAGDVHFERHLAACWTSPRGRWVRSREPSLPPTSRWSTSSPRSPSGAPRSRRSSRLPASATTSAPRRPRWTSSRPPGVDVVTMANNHGADYGPVGLEDTLRADRRGPIPVIGIGRDRARRLRAVPGLRPRHRPGLPGRRRLLARGMPATSGRPGPDNPGVAAARAAASRAPSSRRCGGQPGRRRRGRLPALGRGGPGLPDPQQRAPRGRWPRRAPTSWWAPTPTSCSGRDGWGTPTSTTASGTSLVPRPRAGVRCAPGPGRGRARWWTTPGSLLGSSRGLPGRCAAPAGGRGRRLAAAARLHRPAQAHRRPDRQPPTPDSRGLRAADRSALRDRMRFSHRPGCPLGWGPAPSADRLRRLRRWEHTRRDGRPGTRRTAGRRGPSSSCTRRGGRSAGCGSSTTTGATTTGPWRRTTHRATTAGGSRAAPPGRSTPTAPRSTSTPCRTPT